jgi:hypothetical protein
MRLRQCLQLHHVRVKSVNTLSYQPAPMVRRFADRSVLHYTTDAVQNRALSGGQKTLSICAIPSAATIRRE